MSAVKHTDILFRTGGLTTLRYGRPFIGHRRDASEPEAYTFTRADATTCATYVDADGKIRTAAANKLRLSYVDTALAGTWDACGLLLESSRTNLCLQSENFGTTWVALGTPTRSAGALTCGALSLDLIGDDSGAVAEGYRQTFAGGAITGDAVKALSLFISKGTSPAAGGSVIQFTDTTAVADRLYATITWNGTVPSVVMSTGTLLRTLRLASNVYRLEFQTTSVTAANTHRIDVYPAITAAQTGDLYSGGVMLEDAPYPSSYIKTTTASVTRAADSLTFPTGFEAQSLTLYASVVRPAWMGVIILVSTPYLLQWGGLSVSGGIYTVAKWDFLVGSLAAQAPPPAGVSQVLAMRTGNLAATGADVSVDTGSGYSSLGVTATVVTPTSTATIGPFDGVIADLIVARGSFTLSEMAAAPTP